MNSRCPIMTWHYILQSIVSKGKKDSVTLIKTSEQVTQVFRKYWETTFYFFQISMVN